MKLFLITLTLISVLGCNPVKEADGPNKGLHGTFGISPLTIDQEFSLKPGAFGVFLWPDRISWSRDYYFVGMTFDQKLIKCSETVVRANDLHDGVDRDIFNLEIQKKPYQRRYDELLCEDELDILDCDEDEHECCELEESILTIDMQIMQLIPRKQKLVETIVEALDRDQKHPVNYKVKLDNRYKSQFQIHPDKMILNIIKFGVEEIDYTIDNGGIVEVDLDWPKKTLHFNLRERQIIGYSYDDHNVKTAIYGYTGHIYQFKYSIATFLTNMRLNGDVFYINELNPSEILRRGRSKIDLPVKE